MIMLNTTNHHHHHHGLLFLPGLLTGELTATDRVTKFFQGDVCFKAENVDKRRIGPAISSEH